MPLEVLKYEKWVVLEALHNAIVHQDYGLQSRVIVTETIDQFQFESAGRFYEGRYPKLFVAAHIALATDDKAQYIKNRAFDDAHYKQMVIKYLRKYDHASRKDIDMPLMDKLSDVLNEKQKRNKVRNLLHAMSRRDKTIHNIGSGRSSKWILILDEKMQN